MHWNAAIFKFAELLTMSCTHKNVIMLSHVQELHVDKCRHTHTNGLRAYYGHYAISVWVVVIDDFDDKYSANA